MINKNWTMNIEGFQYLVFKIFNAHLLTYNRLGKKIQEISKHITGLILTLYKNMHNNLMFGF